MDHIKVFGLHPAGPVFAMGASTARALESIGHTLAVEPDVPFNSEALVAQLKQANTDKAVVVTGLGGRAYLGKELRSMNWAVTEIPCYERYFETHTKHAVTDALNTADILSLTSIESMDSLLEQSQHTNDNWQSKPLIVNSGRAKDAAKLAGFTGIIEVAIPAGDQGQIEAIKTVLNMS